MASPRTASRAAIADWRARIHPDDAEQAQADFKAAAKNGEYSSEYRLMLADGTLRHMRTRATVFQDDERPAAHDRRANGT